MLSAQNNKDSIRVSLIDVHKTLTKSFDSLIKDSGSIIEQTALAELTIAEGKITGYRFWSSNEKGQTAWLNPIFLPLVNKYYNSFENLRKIIIPVKVQDFRSEPVDKEPLEGADFLSYFTNAYQLTNSEYLFTSWMLVLSAERGPKREKKKIWNQ